MKEDDAISRQAALGCCRNECEDIAKAFQFGLAFGFGKKYDEIDRVIDEIEKVITPQEPKTGHWIRHTDASGNSWHACPACGHIAHTLTQFCPDCGTRLEAPS